MSANNDSNRAARYFDLRGQFSPKFQHSSFHRFLWFISIELVYHNGISSSKCSQCFITDLIVNNSAMAKYFPVATSKTAQLATAMEKHIFLCFAQYSQIWLLLIKTWMLHISISENKFEFDQIFEKQRVNEIHENSLDTLYIYIYAMHAARVFSW